MDEDKQVISIAHYDADDDRITTAKCWPETVTLSAVLNWAHDGRHPAWLELVWDGEQLKGV